MTSSEQDKTAALHEIAEEVERERKERGRSLVDGENVVSNEPDNSEVDDSDSEPDVSAFPPMRPMGNTPLG